MTDAEIGELVLELDQTSKEEPELFPICPCGCHSLPFRYAPVVEDPPYVSSILAEPAFNADSVIEVERFMIRNKAWDNPDFPDWFWPDHIQTTEDRAVFCQMRHIGMMFPWVTHDPNLVRLIRSAEKGEKLGRKIMNMIGHASSGKTHFMVLDALRMIDIYPENSESFVASPYKTASQYLLWAAFISTVDRLKEHGYRMYRKGGAISLYDGVWEGPGTVTLVSFHAVSVIRGKKLIDPDYGYLGIYLDEAGEFPSAEVLMHILANLKSQRNLRVRTGTNFRNITGLDGRFNQPEEFPWSKLDRERSYFWLSVNGGFTVRMRAVKSPNLLLGRDLFTYLLRDAEHEDLLRYGKDSPYYLSQGDAFPSISSVNRILISDSEVQGANTYSDVDLVNTEPFAFLDPSFTQHGDSAIITSAELGTTKDGDQKIRPLEVDEVNIHEYDVWNEEYLSIARILRQGKPLKPTFRVGEKLDAYDMAALKAGEWLLDRGIPFNNFAFDDSLRGSLTASMVYFLGSGVEPVFYGDTPTNKLTFPPVYKWSSEAANGTKRRSRVRMRFDELCDYRVDQMWFTTVAMIRNGYVRNGTVVEKAIDQLQNRLKAAAKAGRKSTKLSLESKDEYKDRNRQESPDHGDSFCGVVWLIVDRKMSPNEDASERSHRGGTSVVEAIQALQPRRPSRIPRLSR